MKRLIFIFLALLGTAGILSVSINSPSAGAYTNGNLISDQVYYNYNSMSQAQIQNFINKFPNSCLKSQNTFPSGQSAAWQNTTFKEPLDYFTYGGKTSPARIIYKAAQIQKINPQVIIATIEKESDLISGNQGCAAWRYNSALGYNCPDGSENSLRNYPNIGVSGTCVAKESNAGFSAQINHGAWQLSFDGKRANGQTSWLGDGAVTYVGRMTKGNRARVAGGQVTYYDGWTAIDGQRLYLSNGPTAALYNYTPHFNRFASIFTNWFGSTQGSRWTPLIDSRILVTNKATHKINPFTGEQVQSIAAGTEIAFSTKTSLDDGSGCLRTRHDTVNNNNSCIKHSDLAEFTPTIESLNVNNSISIKQTTQWTCKVNFRTTEATNQCFDKSTKINFLKKTRVAGADYLITKIDADSNKTTAFLTNRIMDVPAEPIITILSGKDKKQKSIVWTCKVNLETKKAIESQCYAKDTVVNFSKKVVIGSEEYLITTHDEKYGNNSAFLLKRFTPVD